MKPFKKHRYYCEFYIFKNTIEILPRIWINYNSTNFIGIQWFWFGFYVQIFKK